MTSDAVDVQNAAGDLVLKDQIEVEDFLWRYIEKYHRHELDEMCGRGVKYRYCRNTSPRLLVLESADGSTGVQDISERIASLCQRLVADITETTFPYPDGADRYSCGFAEDAKAVFYIDGKQVCHVVGPKDEVTAVVRNIQGAWTDDQSTVIGQVTTTTTKTSGIRMLTRGGISVEVYTGNLLKDQVDAVVNPANVQLSHDGGAAKTIADAAGSQLRRECREYIKRYGPLKYTQVMHTSAGKMTPPVRYVIHAAGPPADQYHGNSAALRQAVFDTFFNCLRYANEQLHISSMSIPAISSGVQSHRHFIAHSHCPLVQIYF